jgi:SAM-dependent methyltransferase
VAGPAVLTSGYPRRPTGAARAALHAYRAAPLADRAHATVRWWSAPFPAVEAALPTSGRVLEIGCGHGLFSSFAAVASGSRSVVGVDIDAAIIAQADAARRRLPEADLRFVLAPSGAVPTGPWDAIVVIDMLYLLSSDDQRSLLADAAAQLGPGGLLLVKEMSPTPRWKAGWNILQETLSVSILHITERADGDATPAPAAPGQPSGGADSGSRPRFDFVAPDVMAGWLEQSGLSSSSRRLDRHRLHPHHLLIGRRAASAS